MAGTGRGPASRTAAAGLPLPDSASCFSSAARSGAAPTPGGGSVASRAGADAPSAGAASTTWTAGDPCSSSSVITSTSSSMTTGSLRSSIPSASTRATRASMSCGLSSTVSRMPIRSSSVRWPRALPAASSLAKPSSGTPAGVESGCAPSVIQPPRPVAQARLPTARRHRCGSRDRAAAPPPASTR